MSTVLIMAGGTGGHVFPALAVARELRRRGAAAVWLGRRGGLEARIARDENIVLETVNVSGLRGRGLGAVTALVKLPAAAVKALWVARRRRPDVFLGLGGFVSVPGGLAAFLLRRPLVVHEANAVAGLANRALARIASRALSAYPGALPGAAAVGNPVRDDIAQIPAPEQRLANRAGPLRVLVLGGSQGAAAFNRVMPRALAQLREMERANGAAAGATVRHQCGAGNVETVTQAYRQAGGGEGVRVADFIDDMAAAYAWCDIAVCRAGAMTLSELAAAGVGAVLVPFPFAAGRHQDANAAVTAQAGAAIRLPQEQLKPPRMASLLRGFLGAAGREKILRMAACARAMAVTDAAARVADVCLGLAAGRHQPGGTAHA